MTLALGMAQVLACLGGNAHVNMGAGDPISFKSATPIFTYKSSGGLMSSCPTSRASANANPWPESDIDSTTIGGECVPVYVPEQATSCEYTGIGIGIGDSPSPAAEEPRIVRILGWSMMYTLGVLGFAIGETKPWKRHRQLSTAFLLLLALHGVSTFMPVAYAQDPPPPKGLHLADEDAGLHFGPNRECKFGFDAGPPPKIVSSCEVVQPPPPSPPSLPPPPAYAFSNSNLLKTAVQEYNADATAATAKYGPISTWDVSAITDMSGLFVNMEQFNAPIGSWDTSSVTSMQSMFEYASAFNQPLSWDTSSVTDMKSMFEGALAFNQPLNFDTSQVTTMRSMFYGAPSFNQPLSFDTSKVTTMVYMFFQASAFNQPLSFDTSSNPDMSEMFTGSGGGHLV